jgi:hypothetical protein
VSGWHAPQATSQPGGKLISHEEVVAEAKRGQGSDPDEAIERLAVSPVRRLSVRLIDISNSRSFDPLTVPIVRM